MEELAIFDSNGKLVNKTIKRNEDIKRLEKDFHIAVCVIYIENEEGKFLMQKTSFEKGNEYSSTGGHVLRGETPREAIIREVLEELGIDISNDKVEGLGYLHYDRVLRYVFYLKKSIDLNDIKIQIDEVESVKYMTELEIKKLILDKKITESHGIIFNEILNYKKNRTKT